jgi:hypothetical protein
MRSQLLRCLGRRLHRRTHAVLRRDGQPGKQAFRTKPLRSLLGQRSPAARAFFGT